MGSRKPLTRFVVEVGGELKRLFSVREVKAGAIILTTHSGSWEPRDGRLVEILSTKHSIHPSGKSVTGANMVHMTTEYADRTKREHYLLTHAVRDGCFQPIYSRIVVDPRITRTLEPHPKDRIIVLDDFDPSKTSMVYSIWLSSAKAADDFPLNPAYSTAVCSFSRFSLNIAWGFTAHPSKSRSVAIQFLSTSEERITEKERALGYRTGITPGTLPHETAACVIHELNHVIEHEARSPWAAPLVHQKRSAKLMPPRFFPGPPHE